MRGVKLREAVFDVHHDPIGIFERGMGELCIALVIFRVCVVEEAERHINIAFDQLHTDAIGSSIIVGIGHRGPLLAAGKYYIVFCHAAAMRAQP